jgi:queuine/archaeosine tRNA-ribosyltransferase
VDTVIRIPRSWWDKQHRQKLRYFIPEWDDLVDPDYDFTSETHSGGTGDWSNEVYAHQLYPEPNYDGILMSRAVAEKSKKKDARINVMGVHRYVRVPRNFPIMGDCGAFDYIEAKEPPYTTADVLDYYTRLDFDYGVSVDHLIVPAFEAENKFRYELTIHNAQEFLNEHRKAGLKWEPVGAVQGWDPVSYANAVAEYIKMGYRYIGLGGLVRCSTREIISILRQVHAFAPKGVNVHLFGIARPEALHQFNALGVTSVDSASHLRRAWLTARDNYFTLDGESYSSLRIPEVGKSYRAKRVINGGKVDQRGLLDLESKCLQAVRAFDRYEGNVFETVDLLLRYHALIRDDGPDMRGEYERTLKETPWKYCSCEICRRWGVEVMIFRGNNRNRRRGFHNTYVFYRLMQDALITKKTAKAKSPQVDLFNDSIR